MRTKHTLSSLRIRANLTQADAATKLGVSRETLIKWEKDSSNIPMKHALDIATFYDIPIENIYFGDAEAYYQA